MKENYVRKPDWLKVESFSGENYNNVVGILKLLPCKYRVQ